MSKTIFITGANGFLGSRITRLALKNKYRVKAFVRNTTNLDDINDKNLEFCFGDLRDKSSIEKSLTKVDFIFHVAADYRLWSKKKSEIYESNVFGTENLLKAACEVDHKKIIFTSSVATLGYEEGKISDESTKVNILDMKGHYKKSKYIAERIFQEYIEKSKINGIIVNPSTPIGPGDFKPTPTGRIILKMLKKDFPGYVETGLNFVHVDDVAIGHFLALNKGKIGEKYILGGENVDFKDFLDRISEFAKVPKVKIKLNRYPLFPLAYFNQLIALLFKSYEPMLTIESLKMSERKMFFSSEKAKKLLGYRPRNINSAIKESIESLHKKFILVN